jgi:hypothetical protein
MHESLIQSYAHFTYHANYMFNALVQSLHGVRNPQPWSFIPPQQPQQQQPQWQQQQQQQQPHQPHQQHPQQQPQQQQQPHAHRYQSSANALSANALSANALSANATPLSVNAIPFRSNALGNSIVNTLIGMLTPDELDERVELARFENIVNPLNTTCSITQDAFEPSQQVARIRHCGHIFNSDSLARWLRLNNTCPTCRYNLRSASASATATSASATATSASATATSASAATSASSALNLLRVFDVPLESDINAVYNELIRNSANIPGFELNSVGDDSIVFSFDLTSNRQNGGPRNIDDVD